MFRRPLAITFLSFVFVWCVLAADGRITGRLTDPQDKPVAGAKLRMSSAAATTSIETTSVPDGRFVFPSVAPGDYQIHRYCPRICDASKMLHLGDGKALTVDFALQSAKPPQLSGTVVDTSGAAIAGATVQVKARTVLH